jgi:hypothetical protein
VGAFFATRTQSLQPSFPHTLKRTLSKLPFCRHVSALHQVHKERCTLLPAASRLEVIRMGTKDCSLVALASFFTVHGKSFLSRGINNLTGCSSRERRTRVESRFTGRNCLLSYCLLSVPNIKFFVTSTPNKNVGAPVCSNTQYSIFAIANSPPSRHCQFSNPQATVKNSQFLC